MTTLPVQWMKTGVRPGGKIKDGQTASAKNNEAVEFLKTAEETQLFVSSA